MPITLKLTGYRLFIISGIAGLCISKAYSNSTGQSLILPVLGWLGEVYIFLFISFWLSLIDVIYSKKFSWFFETDYGSSILEFLCCNDVHLSLLPFLLAMEGLSFVEHTKRQFAECATTSEIVESKDAPTPLVLGSFMAVFVFCLRLLKVLSTKDVEGHRLSAFFPLEMMLGLLVLYLAVKLLRANSNDLMFPQVMITMSMRPYIWMMTWATPLPSELLHHEGHTGGPILGYIPHTCNVLLCVSPILFETANVLYTWKLLDFRERVYRSLFLCIALLPLWKRFSAIITPSDSDKKIQPASDVASSSTVTASHAS